MSATPDPRIVAANLLEETRRCIVGYFGPVLDGPRYKTPITAPPPALGAYLAKVELFLEELLDPPPAPPAPPSEAELAAGTDPVLLHIARQQETP